MQISASFLSIKDNLLENIKKLDNCDIDFLHVDVMDGLFVDNTTQTCNQLKYLLENTNKPKDIHLMVKDVKKHIDDLKTLNPQYITFHVEAVNNVLELINYIKSLNIKVGISIKPNTDISMIKDYLNIVDLILVMTVEPGLGGQKFINSQLIKIDILNKLRKINNYNYVIEIDGGINGNNIIECKKLGTDIAVVGSFITNGDYNVNICKIKNIY